MCKCDSVWILQPWCPIDASLSSDTRMTPRFLLTCSLDTLDIPPYLQVAAWNRRPFRKHLFGDSLHSQEHLVLLRGWCLGHVLTHAHWQVSLLKTWLSGQEGADATLQTHWQVLRSTYWLGPQSWV